MTSATTVATAPAEVEAALARLASNPAVRGVVVLDRVKGLPIKSSGALFSSAADADGSTMQRYAQRAWQLVEAAQDEIEGMEAGVRWLCLSPSRSSDTVARTAYGL
jgi:hypothetical protein